MIRQLSPQDSPPFPQTFCPVSSIFSTLTGSLIVEAKDVDTRSWYEGDHLSWWWSCWTATRSEWRSPPFHEELHPADGHHGVHHHPEALLKLKTIRASIVQLESMISTHLNLILDPSGGGTSATSIFLEEHWCKISLISIQTTGATKTTTISLTAMTTTTRSKTKTKPHLDPDILANRLSESNSDSW